jgi:hypothetical protein
MMAILCLACSSTKTRQIGKPGPLPGETVKEIQGELMERVKVDQEVRKDPRLFEENAAAIDRMIKVDRENTQWLKANVSRYGWIDVDRFGAEAAHAAFLLVQHSQDLPLMVAALPLIERDVRAGKLGGEPYALLYDRVQIKQGRKQKYGSQVVEDENGDPVVAPLEDPERVEEYRREMGMLPMDEYLELVEQMLGRKVKR